MGHGLTWSLLRTVAKTVKLRLSASTATAVS